MQKLVPRSFDLGRFHICSKRKDVILCILVRGWETAWMWRLHWFFNHLPASFVSANNLSLTFFKLCTFLASLLGCLLFLDHILFKALFCLYSYTASISGLVYLKKKQTIITLPLIIKIAICVLGHTYNSCVIQLKKYSESKTYTFSSFTFLLFIITIIINISFFRWELITKKKV